MGQPECCARADTIKEEQFLVLSNFPVVSLGGLLKQLLVLFEGLSNVSISTEKRKEQG